MSKSITHIIQIMKSIKAGLLASLTIFLYCCNSHNFVETAQTDDEQTNLSFSTIVEDNATTRKAGNSWENKDAIGVFSFESGKPNSQATVDNLLNNKKFVTNGDGTFTVEAGETPISYPEAGRDIIAYFPFDANTAVSQDLTYIVNLTDQRDIDKIDLLYSNNLKNFSKGKKAELVFKHALSKFNIKVSSKEYDLTNAKIELTNFNTKADFNLVSQALLVDQTLINEVSLPYTVIDGKLSATALILPTNQVQNFTVRITLSDGQVVRWAKHKEKGWKWEAGKTYTQEISVGKNDGGDPVDPDPEPGQKYGFFETPQGNESSNTQFVVHNVSSGSSANLRLDSKGNPQRNYTMLYDKRYKIAYWVAYPQHKNYIGSTKRTNAWAYDPLVDRNDQINLKSSYKENYSRGHQIASGDRTADSSLNRPTFYYTNMTPQTQNGLNGDIWAHLEGAVRGYVPGNDTLWVVTGAGLPKDPSKIQYAHSKSGEPTAIPTYYYKVIAKKVGGKYYTLGFRLDHRVHSKGEHYNDFRVTVKSLEQETGFTFFPGIPAADKEVIVNSQW